MRWLYITKGVALSYTLTALFVIFTAGWVLARKMRSKGGRVIGYDDRFQLRMPFWRFFLPSTWSALIGDHMRFIASSWNVVGISTRPTELPRFSYFVEELPNKVACYHIDEAVLINMRYGGTITKTHWWKSLTANRYE